MEKIIELPPTGDISRAWIRLRIRTEENAKSVTLDDLFDVECVEIDGFCQHAGYSWEGHDIADLVANYPDHPDVLAIAPLWERWGQHSQKRRTLDQQDSFDKALQAGIFPYKAEVAIDSKTGEKVIIAKGDVKDPELTFEPVADEQSLAVYVEPLDVGVLDEIKTAFGVR